MRLLAALLFVLPTTALAYTIGYTAVNRFQVADIGNSRFEVIARGGRVTAQQYWCAAGDYGVRRGLQASARVYVAKAEGASLTVANRKAVQFTFDPKAAGVTPVEPQLSLTVRVPGDNMQIASARQFCRGTFLDF